MQIDYNQLYKNAKDDFEEIDEDLKYNNSLSKKNREIYNILIHTCYDMSEEEISNLSELAKEYRRLIIERDRLQEVMEDAMTNYMTQEKKNTVLRILYGPDYEYEEDRFYAIEDLPVIENEYFSMLWGADIEKRKRERIEQEQNNEEYDSEADEPEEDDN